MVEHLDKFLWLNDVINFGRTCKRIASITKSLVDEKMDKRNIREYLRPTYYCYRHKVWAFAYMLKKALETGDVESYEFFFDRIGDSRIWIEPIGSPGHRLRYRHDLSPFLEILPKYEKSKPRACMEVLNCIMIHATENEDVLLVRRCITMGASRWISVPRKKDTPFEDFFRGMSALGDLMDINLTIKIFDKVFKDTLPRPLILQPIPISPTEEEEEEGGVRKQRIKRKRGSKEKGITT